MVDPLRLIQAVAEGCGDASLFDNLARELALPARNHLLYNRLFASSFIISHLHLY